MSIIHKTVISPVVDETLNFILSDESVDRYGDTIEVTGWQTENFVRNPIALFNHNPNFPIGFWKNVRVDPKTKALKGQLVLAQEGTSSRIDEIRSLLQQGILKAVSVGFKSLERQFNDPERPHKGTRFKKHELLETSLVSVPANANAVQVARSLGTSPEVMEMVFGEHADNDQPITRGLNGGNAKKPHLGFGKMNLSQRIEAAEARLLELRSQLGAYLDNLGDEPDAEAMEKTTELNAQISSQSSIIDTLKVAESRLAVDSDVQERSAMPPRGTTLPVVGNRPFAAPAKKVKPADFVYRSLTASVLAHYEKKPRAEVLKERYGECESTKAVLDAITRSASAPATTTTSGWAAELVNTAIAEFLDSLMPASIYPGLSTLGGRFTFGANGIVSLPSRSSTPTIAGSFVGQGAPIPVRQGAFAATTLTPKKMGVISTFTREIAEHSTPSIEAMIRQAIQEDTAVAIDSVLIDTSAATSVRPAGLRNGVSGLSATSGGGVAALIADVKGLVGALITATNGSLRNPVWIMNPIQAVAISLTANAAGDFPFSAQIAAGTFQGYPILMSATVTAGMLVLVDAADFFSATGDAPRFDVSDQAVLHMEDTTPLAIGVAGSPNTVAAPVRSLWQTDTLGIRMLLDINWALRRTGTVAWVSSVTW